MITTKKNTRLTNRPQHRGNDDGVRVGVIITLIIIIHRRLGYYRRRKHAHAATIHTRIAGADVTVGAGLPSKARETLARTGTRKAAPLAGARLCSCRRTS